MIRGETVTAVDLGSSQVSALMLEWRGENAIRFLAFDSLPSQGVTHGEISDAAKVREVVLQVLKNVERQGGRRIGQYSLVFGGVGSYGRNLRGVITLSGRGGVSEKDVQQVSAVVEEGPRQQGFAVLHNLPRVYRLDDEYFPHPPWGKVGKVLEVVGHAILTPATSVRRLLSALQYDAYLLDEIVFSSLSASYALLDRTQKRKATLLMDFGYGTVDVSLFYLGLPYFSQVYSLGCCYLERDLCEVLGVSPSSANLLIVEQAGCSKACVDSGDWLKVDGIEFTRGKLSQIVFARMEETLLLIRDELNRSGVIVEKLDRVILYGGGSRLEGLADLTRKILGLETVVGVPFGIDGGQDCWKNPAAVSLVGLGVYSFCKKHGSMGGLRLWLKKIFA